MPENVPPHIFLHQLLIHHRGGPKHRLGRRQRLPLPQGAAGSRDAANARQAFRSEGGGMTANIVKFEILAQQKCNTVIFNHV